MRGPSAWALLEPTEEERVQLRYGINPDQRAAIKWDGPRSPLRLVAGEPSYINILDALNAWQLVRAADRALDAPVATSFKHVSPAGAATAGALDEVMEETWKLPSGGLSPVASAYVRARDCDPRSSYGDFVAVSQPVDHSLADLLASVVSNGIIAPGFEPGTVERLSKKAGGRFVVIETDPDFQPPDWERRELFGVRLEQQTAPRTINRELVRSCAPTDLPDGVVDDLVLAMVTARYTQSNSVTYARGGMVLGVGAGQQSRIDCTRLAGRKADTWWLRRHPKVRALSFPAATRRQDHINWRLRYIEGDMTPSEQPRFADATRRHAPPLTDDERSQWLTTLDGVSLASDGYIPFRDNVDEAASHGVRFLADPGGSVRDDEVESAAVEHGITLLATGMRLFHH